MRVRVDMDVVDTKNLAERPMNTKKIWEEATRSRPVLRDMKSRAVGDRGRYVSRREVEDGTEDGEWEVGGG